MGFNIGTCDQKAKVAGHGYGWGPQHDPQHHIAYDRSEMRSLIVVIVVRGDGIEPTEIVIVRNAGKVPLELSESSQIRVQVGRPVEWIDENYKPETSRVGQSNNPSYRFQGLHKMIPFCKPVFPGMEKFRITVVRLHITFNLLVTLRAVDISASDQVIVEI
jgi:hypothetical protein